MSSFIPKDQTRSEPAPTIVLKLGGSVLRDESSLPVATREILSWTTRGFRVVAVVSAFEGVTDFLVRKASKYAIGEGHPDAEGKALLLSTGELMSASLLMLALHRIGVHARVAPAWTIGVLAKGDPLDAMPTGLNPHAFARLFDTTDVIVVPGFMGLDEQHRLVLLGRGGSDLSALFVADAIGAERCRLIKDVDGLYEYDPADPRIAAGAIPAPARLNSATWDEALGLDGGIVQHKAVRFAKERGLEFEVGTYAKDNATRVGSAVHHSARRESLCLLGSSE